VGIVEAWSDAGAERLYLNMRSPGGGWNLIWGWDAMFLVSEPWGLGE
jgi:hypothetical protein